MPKNIFKIRVTGDNTDLPVAGMIQYFILTVFQLTHDISFAGTLLSNRIFFSVIKRGKCYVQTVQNDKVQREKILFTLYRGENRRQSQEPTIS